MLSWPPRSKQQPPVLRGTIPYVSNTVQYMTNAGAFLDRVSNQLKETKSNIIKFHVGFTPAYIVTGSPEVLDVNFLMLRMMEAHWGVSPAELGQVPAPGTEHTPDDQRYWHGHDRLYVDYLTNRKYSDALAETFYRLFSERLDRQPVAEWTTVNLFQFLKATMAESAVISLFGSQIVDLNPGIIEAYWDFDAIAGPLAWGLPQLSAAPVALAIEARLHEMTRRHIDSAWEHFDWDGPDAEATWDPHWGSRLSRESARWLRQGGFSNHAAAGHTLATLFGLNGNTVPITTWAMIEAIKDPSLFQALREEAQSAYTATDPKTGTKHIDAQKLVALPLMQSLYVETMRLHVSLNIARQAKQPLEIDGFRVRQGALVQTCSQVAHYDEAVWAAGGHPATEFWGWRHVKEVEVVDEGSGETVTRRQFAMKARPSSFFSVWYVFPRGGYVMCPGRHFAKQEILLAVAVLVSKFDMEFVEWTNPDDGSRSDRPGLDDRRYAAFLAMSPDREMKIRWRRNW
ncbi:cytochrome P450 [Podospora appendiculata]|uniref:Cytochrome P450 n=1 Tax=Podospora appendiculata TaxID=314037 RepID=A0AAE0X5D2_9PEZI|nr:cytochrome P450 [Podospora appendiculata]